MKTLFTLLSGALLSISAFASDVTVTLSNNNKYQVLIDGRNLYNNGYSNNSNTFYLRNLSTGQHNIQVVRARNNNNGRWNNNNNDVVYSSSFSVEPQYDLFIQVDNRGRVAMDQRRTAYNGGYNNGNGRYGRDRDRDHDGDRDGDDRRNDRNGNWNNGGYGNDNNRGYGNGHNGSYNNGSYGGYGNSNRAAMNDADFNQLVQHIRSQWFGKFNTAKQTVSNASYYFSTYQVRQVLQIFSSESDKLELAKLAYRQTVDPNNYRQLYDLFSYNGQTELDNYIRSFRY